MKRREFVRSSLFAAAAALPAARSFHAVSAEAAQPADIAAVTGDGRAITLRGADIKDLAARVRGRVLLANDAGYDDARRILNPSFDKRPALIVQPTGAADVQAAVSFARANNLLLAVKCGGHSHSGQSTCDRGMQLDLSSFRGVRVDPKARRAWVSGGTLLGQVDHESMAQGLVTPLGTVSHTGVGGLTLGGGFGRLARRFGMSIDNLESVEIVTADGRLLHASAKDNPDLFWAVRGGGGNFGVVTTFEFRLHPMQRQVVAGAVLFPIERAADVLRFFGEYSPTCPDELYFDPIMTAPPGGGPGVALFDVCYSGPHERAESVLAPIRKLGPMKDMIKAVDYLAAQRANDQTDTRAVSMYVKGGFITEVKDGLVSAITEGFEPDPARGTFLFFQHCGGATARVRNDATAFAQRGSLANMMVASAWRHGNDPREHMDAMRRYWKKLDPFTYGFYVNDMDPEASAAQINENYRGNYARLVAVKTKHDPTNLFRLNANVQPKV
jgi:hypothetical protein